MILQHPKTEQVPDTTNYNLDAMEKDLITKAMSKADRQITAELKNTSFKVSEASIRHSVYVKAAELLGISYLTLRDKITKYQLPL